MNNIYKFLKRYLVVITILITVSIVLSMSYSNFIVTSENHKVAEMYIGTLKYSMSIDGTNTNTLSVPNGETIIDVTINNENLIDTYYKLIYENNSNVTITYYEGYKLDNSNNISNSYDLPNDKLLNSGTKTLKLKIVNNSTTSQTIIFKVIGGFATNTLDDVTVPSEYTTIEKDTSTNTYFCTTTDTLTQGLQYVNGQYTYAYKQEGKPADSGLAWQNITSDGWGVQLTNKTSTDAVTSKVCTYINNKPITSMSYMFERSQATTLALSNFNTSNVTNMDSMFYRSQATTLDVSNFNTSKVTNMSDMFFDSKATTLDVSNLNTSKVTNMGYMFAGSKATTLDVSNFDTSNVTNMGYMFWISQATTLDVSNFNTSNVTDMDYMFNRSQATTLDVSNFNTSKVTNMANMFFDSKVTTLDLSNFDTSKVTNMMSMFQGSSNLKTIYVINKFNTDKVTYSTNMFSGCTNLVGGAGTKYDSTKIDKTYARIDGGTSSPGYFTSIPEPNSFSSDSWMTIVKAVKSGNISKYNVGDTKTVNLGTYGTHTLRVANISKSDSCGNSGYSESGCGFVIEFADIITNRVINSTSTTRGSWSATTIRTFVNNDIYNLLPTDLKNGILNTYVITGHGNSESNNSASTDKLYLLSPIEIYGSVSITYDSANNVTNQLDYYKQNNVSLNSYDSAIKNTVVSGGTGSASAWWTRTPAQIMDGQFMMVTNTGNLYSTYLTQQLGVSPAFRIG